MWLNFNISGRILATLRLTPLLLLILFSSNMVAGDIGENNPVFARINDRTIQYIEFMEIFHSAVRYKYYHGEVPNEELATFQRQVGKDIVEQEIIHQQALKLGLKPSAEKIEKGLNEYNKKYQDSLVWQAQKEKSMHLLLDWLKRQDLIEQMQYKIKDVEKPAPKAVQEYYKKHPAKFTEPARVWVSVILLAVPPSASKQTWLDADSAAKQLIARIKKGQSFTNLARRYSVHPSAINGGDLGYLHQGMLDGDAMKAVDNLKINELSGPVRVLEGVTIFRLNGIQSEKLKSFNEVAERAAGLLYRELQENTWETYLNKLMHSADIFVNEKLYTSQYEK